MSDQHDNNGKFRKGNNANPLGGAAHNPEKKKIKKLTEDQLVEVMNLILTSDHKSLNDIIAENPTVLKTWIASAVHKGIKRGELGPLLAILERVVGKVKDQSVVDMNFGDNKKIEVEVVTADKNKKTPDDEQ